MKCDRPFIHAYNELFKFLDHFGGRPNVELFWELLGHAILGRFRELVTAKGFAGMIEYWTDTLTAEGADYTIVADIGNKDCLDNVHLCIWKCPSRSKLEEPYEHYCDHCKALYGHALNELGYIYSQQPDEKGCEIWVNKKDSSSSETADTPTPVST